MLLRIRQRQRRQKALFFPKRAGHDIEILRDKQLSHFTLTPFQILCVVGGHRNEDVHIIKILIVGKPLLQEVPAADSTVQIVKVAVGIAGFSDLGTVDTKLLTELVHHTFLRLTGQKQVDVDPVAGIDKQTQPTGRHL